MKLEEISKARQTIESKLILHCDKKQSAASRSVREVFISIDENFAIIF